MAVIMAKVPFLSSYFWWLKFILSFVYFQLTKDNIRHSIRVSSKTQVGMWAICTYLYRYGIVYVEFLMKVYVCTSSMIIMISCTVSYPCPSYNLTLARICNSQLWMSFSWNSLRNVDGFFDVKHDKRASLCRPLCSTRGGTSISLKGASVTPCAPPNRGWTPSTRPRSINSAGSIDRGM